MMSNASAMKASTTTAMVTNLSFEEFQCLPVIVYRSPSHLAHGCYFPASGVAVSKLTVPLGPCHDTAAGSLSTCTP